MFRCKDCGSEYSVKPDFCDCGNDTFDEIVEAASPSYSASTYSSPSYSNEYVETPTPKRKKTFREQYPMLSRFFDSLDPISVIIFIICISLSVGSFFVIKPKEVDTDLQNQVAAKPEPKNVPDINTFWDDTPPKKVAKAKLPESNVNKGLISQVTEISQKEKPQEPVVSAPIKKEQPKQTVNSQVANKKTTTVQQNTKPKTQQTDKKSAPVQQKTQQKAQSSPQSKTQSSQVNTKQPTQTPQPTVTPTVQPTPQTPAPTISVAKPQNTKEFNSYKDGLKRTLFSKMNMLNVYGDGACVVDFKINSSGKLVNKSFSKQSSNNTLNDEVYKAIMSTPSYKVPPESYNGQTLHFSVKMTNGQFEVKLY